MIFYEQESGLKGQYNIAQGNPGKAGSRPGLKDAPENRPCENVHQSETLVSDGEMAFCYLIMMLFHSVRNDFFALFVGPSRTVFFCLLYPGRRFGSFLSQLAPG